MRKILLATVFLLPVPSLVASAAEPAAPVPRVFQNDSRLSDNLTVSLRNRPLGEALPGIGERLKVPLSASRETADDKVSLFVKDRPANEVLAQLARQFDFQWIRSGKGFELTQDLVTRRREAALREGDTAARIAALRSRMDVLHGLSQMGSAQLEAKQHELENELMKADTSPADRASLTDQIQTIRDLTRPGGFAAVALYSSLNAVAREQLWSGGVLSLSTGAGTLSPVLANQIQQAAHDLRSRATLSIGPGGITAGPPPSQDEPPSTGAEATIRLTTAGFYGGSQMPGPGNWHLQFMMESVSDGNGRRGRMPVMWSPTPPNASADDEETPAPGDPDLDKPVDLGFKSASGSSPDPSIRNTITTARVSFGGGPGRTVTIGEVEERLHQETGLEFLSDSYVRARVDRGSLAGKQTPRQILDRISKSLAYRWSKQGNLIQLRSRVYFWDRPEEVPDRILNPWRARFARTGAPRLDDLADLAAALTDLQARGMQDFWSVYVPEPEDSGPKMPGNFYGNREHLRFWAGLSRNQRAAAAQGIVPVTRMSAIQARAFATAVSSQQDGPMLDLGGTPPITRDAIASGGFSLKQSELHQQSFRGTSPDGQTLQLMTLRAPGALPPGAGGGGPPTAPGGGPLPSLVAGPVTVLDNFQFHYFLNGSDQPARTASIAVPQPKQSKPSTEAPTGQ